MNYKGNLLIANLSIYGDPFFSKSVILVIEDEDGFVTGIVLNSALELNLGNVLENCYSFNDTPIYNGGPVAEDELYFLHNNNQFGGIKIKDNLYISSDLENAFFDFTQTDTFDGNIRFFLGYCGWTKQQLNDEIEKNYWLVVSDFDENILQKTPSDLWKELIVSFNDIYNIWANAPTDPSMN